MLGNFSLSNIINSFNTDAIAYILIFLILFAIIQFVLKKTMFKESKGILTVISISSALLAVYGLIRANFSIADLMFALNLPPMFQYNLIWILLLIAFIFLWAKYDFGITLIVFGAGLFLIGALKLVYANASIGVFGAVLLLFGIWLKWKNRDKDMQDGTIINTTNNINVPGPGESSINFLGFGPKKRIPREMRTRSRKELQKKYNFYSKKIQKIQKRNNGRIPKKGTKEGHKRHRYIQAMNAIENTAKRQGFRLR